MASQRGEQNLGRMAPDIVENNVEVLTFKGCGQFLIRLVEGDRRIRTEIGQGFQDVSVSAGGENASGTQVLCDLDRQFASDAGRTEDKDGLAGFESGSPDERKPR